MSEQAASQTPEWELVLKRCWAGDCDNVATAQDWAGWWFCEAHRDRLQDGQSVRRVTWAEATDAIRQVVQEREAAALARAAAVEAAADTLCTTVMRAMPVGLCQEGPQCGHPACEIIRAVRALRAVLAERQPGGQGGVTDAPNAHPA